MGRKNSVVSFLCGVLFRKKPPAVEDAEDEFEEALSSPTASTSGGATLSPEDAAATKPCSPHHQSLPMPPGNGNYHMRTASCGHNLQHRRANSSVSKLMSSMSLRVMGGGAAVKDEKQPRVHEKRTKYFKHEDSVWKKAIILGERCRVPDEDDDDINLYDEKGHKIITYHPKSHSGLLQYSNSNSNSNSRQNITSLNPHPNL